MYNDRKHVGGRLLGMMEIVVMVHFIYMSKLKIVCFKFVCFVVCQLCLIKALKKN